MLLEPLFLHAKTRSGDIAVIDDHGRYTFAQVAGLATGLATLIQARTQKSVVGLLLPSGVGFVASFYGTLLAGKSVVPVNFLLGDREIAHVIADSGIDTIITVAPLASRVKNASLKVIDFAEAAAAIAAAATQSKPTAPTLPPTAADAMAVLMYTSGTSALPKGVILSYGNLQSDVEAAITHARLQGDHIFLGIVPLFHSTGMLATLLAPITLGSTVIYIARFSPVATVKAIRENRVSIMAAVPSMYGAIIRLKDAAPDDFTSLYAAISGGEPLPTAIREGFHKRFKQPIYEGYGLTETIGPIAFNVPGAMQPGSVGRLIPGAAARITADDGSEAPQGATGEIWLRGPMVMKGYFGLPRETADVLTPDGYFKSGDLGFIDPQGYLHVTGRKKELIIVAGEKVVPREVEEILLHHPDVADAAVIGRPDPLRGEAVVAFIIPREGHSPKPDELRDYCRRQNLPNFKVPREIIFVPELPRSPTGKVLKRVLAEQLAKTPADPKTQA